MSNKETGLTRVEWLSRAECDAIESLRQVANDRGLDSAIRVEASTQLLRYVQSADVEQLVKAGRSVPKSPQSR